MAAHVLTRAGASVIMLEAGPMWDNAKRLGDAQVGSRITPPGHEHTRSALSASSMRAWVAGNCRESPTPGPRAPNSTGFGSGMLGGRTNHWGRISLRFGPDDFRHRTLDGLGDDWPISYDDLKPWYDEVDRLIGLFGSAEGLRNHPDGIFLPPPRPRCWELLVKRASDRLKIPCIASRLSILTKPLNGRPACHYCGQCHRGCAVNANFTSPNVLILPALASGRLTLVTGAMARR